jgi:plasmid stability protein
MRKSEHREILKAALKGTKRRRFAAALGEDSDFERQPEQPGRRRVTPRPLEKKNDD